VVEEDYSILSSDKRITFIEIEGGHDFEAEAREPLVRRIAEILV